MNWRRVTLGALVVAGLAMVFPQNTLTARLGKHDFIVRKAANRIAMEVGRSLMILVMPIVPEGDYAPRARAKFQMPIAGIQPVFG